MPKIMFKQGSIVKISTEEPIFDNKGKRIDGKKAKILDIGKRKAKIKVNRKIEKDFPIALFAAPDWYMKLSADEMAKAMQDQKDYEDTFEKE